MSHKYLLKRRLQSVWHSCIPMKQHEVSLVPIDRGRGIWLYDFEDRRYLDAIRCVYISEQEMDLLAAGLCRRLIHSKN